MITATKIRGGYVYYINRIFRYMKEIMRFMISHNMALYSIS